MYIFDGENKLIILENGLTTFESVDLYSRWKEWVQTSDNSKYIQAMRSIGGEDIGGGQKISAYVILMNGWKIRPYEADHALVVVGNIITDDASNSFVTTLGNYNVQIQSIVTSNSLTTTGGGGGLTLEEHNKLMANLTITNYLQNKE